MNLLKAESMFPIGTTFWPFYRLLAILIWPLWCRTRNILGQLAAAMPQAVTVTPEEREAIERVSYLSRLCWVWSFVCAWKLDTIMLPQCQIKRPTLTFLGFKRTNLNPINKLFSKKRNRISIWDVAKGSGSLSLTWREYFFVWHLHNCYLQITTIWSK